MYTEASQRQREYSLHAFAHQDDYPTRLAEMPAQLFLPRREILVPRSEPGGPLNKQQLANFERDGFLFEPDFLSDAELRELQHELRALLNNTRFRDKEYAVTEPDSQEIRSLFAVHFLSARFRQLAEDSRLRSRVRQILGGDSYIHQSRINYKPGFAGKGFNWHSDFETWHAEDGMPGMRAVSASIILTDNHRYNGPLMLIPGSHKHFVPCVGETPNDNYKVSLKSQQIGTPSKAALARLMRARRIQAPTGRAGGLILFDCNTLHGSNANMSPDPRSNVFFVYNRVDNLCVEPFAARSRRPEFLAHRSDGRWLDN